jgi:excisionase family DNA binding protein
MYLTVAEAASIIRVGQSTLRKYIRDGTGPRVCKLGFLVRIYRPDLEAWVRGKSIPPVDQH